MSDIVKGYEACPLGCGLMHRVGLREPLHSVDWLERERQRLLAAIETARWDGEAEGLRRALELVDDNECDVRATLQMWVDDPNLGTSPARFQSAAPTDDLAVARARRNQPVGPQIDTRADAGGITMDVDLGRDPERP